MSNPLLATKFYVPQPRPGLVSRPRLLHKLEEGLRQGHRLFLVSAPAGSGKTTLIAEWLSKSEVRDSRFDARISNSAWLSLDAEDNDPARFLTYVGAALETVKAGVGTEVLSLLQSPQPPPLRVVLTSLINALSALTTDFTLVLDDYHVIESQPIHEALSFLIDHLPRPMRLVIASRVDPPLPLARLRVRNQLMELRAADLRFTSDEAAAFLNQVMALKLSAEDIVALEARTEGWIAGLQLAAISMQGRQDISGFIAAFTGSDRYVLDYLVEEVLHRQPEGIQTFLLQTSILDRLCGPLCDSVISLQYSVSSPNTGYSQPILEYLEKSNLFIIPLDNERRWYRYHQLFAEFLRSRLEACAGGMREETFELHHRAAEWYEANAFIPEAIKHALEAQDFEHAAHLIESVGRTTLMFGEARSLLNWLGALPDAMIRSRPRLCLIRAWCLMFSSQVEVIEECLQEAVQSAPGDVGILGEVAALRALIANLQGDVHRAIELARQALEFLPAEETFLRSLLALNLGLAYDTLGDMAASVKAYTEAIAISQTTGVTIVALMAAVQLADIKALQGKLREAASIYEQTIQQATHSGKSLNVISMAYANMGRLLYEWNDLETAARYLTTCIELGHQWGSADMIVAGSVYLALVRQAQGDFAGVMAFVHQAEQAMEEPIYSTSTVNEAKAYQARLWVRQGNMEAASRWMQEYEAHANDAHSNVYVIERTTLARVLLAQNNPEVAARLLESLLQTAEATGKISNVIEILALQALALEAQGKSDPAMATLQRALEIAEPEGFTRTFVDEGPAMERLLKVCRLHVEGSLRHYVERMLSVFNASSNRQVGFQPSTFQTASLIEPLSERELNVLRLIAGGLSNQEIAQKLVVAVSTVKSHINNIYGKINAQSRVQAVSRARELNLL